MDGQIDRGMYHVVGMVMWDEVLQEHSGRILHPAILAQREISSLKWIEICRLKWRKKAESQRDNHTGEKYLA